MIVETYHLLVPVLQVWNEGEPVRQMLFIVRGSMESSYRLHHNNSTSECMLNPGQFCGEELISWCLSKPLHENLPLSTATLKTRKLTESFALEAQDLKYITQHFRHKFANEKLRRAVRFYSSSWQTWAAVTIQLAWQRHRARQGLESSVIATSSADSEVAIASDMSSSSTQEHEDAGAASTSSPIEDFNTSTCIGYFRTSTRAEDFRTTNFEEPVEDDVKYTASRFPTYVRWACAKGLKR